MVDLVADAETSLDAERRETGRLRETLDRVLNKARPPTRVRRAIEQGISIVRTLCPRLTPRPVRGAARDKPETAEQPPRPKPDRIAELEDQLKQHEARIAELEDELKRRDARIAGVRADLDKAER